MAATAASATIVATVASIPVPHPLLAVATFPVPHPLMAFMSIPVAPTLPRAIAIEAALPVSVPAIEARVAMIVRTSVAAVYVAVMVMTAARAGVAEIRTRVAQGAIAAPVQTALDAVALAVETLGERPLAGRRRDEREEVELSIDRPTAAIESSVVVARVVQVHACRVDAGLAPRTMAVTRGRFGGEGRAQRDRRRGDGEAEGLGSVDSKRLHQIILQAAPRGLCVRGVRT